MTACTCDERRKPVSVRRWRVYQRLSHRSAFAGYRLTRSAYSAVICLSCGARWRSSASYVSQTPDATEFESGTP